MKRVPAVVSTFVAAFLVATGSVAYASTLSQAKLSAELLTLGQMPSGWHASSSAGLNGVGCIHNLLEPRGVTQTHHAEVYYLAPLELPLFDEKVATYSNAKSAYRKIIATINACHSTSGQVDGMQTRGTISSMTLAHYGNASSAYAMTFIDQVGTLHYDYLIVRKGNVVAGILEAGYPFVSTSQFQGFVAMALAKMT